VDIVLKALARQRFPLSQLDVVVVDNGSSDGTVDTLAAAWDPQAIVENPTAAAHEPQFSRGAPTASGGSHAFASLTIIRNQHNLGGCGGFNTGLAFVESHLDRPADPLSYVWLVDDDVDLPENALSQLVATGESDPMIGLIGSRTVDFADRETTIETTIYFDHENGWMGPDPTPAHPRHADHAQWVGRTGGTRGKLAFSGVRPVDVVSACSLLARWSAVKRVGFWDARFFIYCDDADWCLRFSRAGFRVVLDLDAVVYHTYWLSKLTPARAYYSQRNLLWLIQKNFAGAPLRRSTLRRLIALLRDSRKAAMHCRLFHAEIIRRTAHDIVTGRGGKLDNEGPAHLPLAAAFDQASALRAAATVLVMCSHPESVEWADQLRVRLAYALIDSGRPEAMPRFVYMVRDSVPDPDRGEQARPQRIVFSPNRGSKWRAQRSMLRSPPTAVVVFDQHNDFPLIRSRANLHIDRRRPTEAQLERDGIRPRLAFLARWAGTAAKSLLYALRVRPYVRTGKYG
jgi:GT2 family glycosyltransferase